MTPNLKTGLIVGAGVLAAIIIYEVASSANTGPSSSDDGGPPSVSTSIKYGVATATAAGAAWVIVVLLGTLL